MVTKEGQRILLKSAKPRKRVKDCQKTIGFADSLNIVGRWHEQMGKNETTRKEFKITPGSNKKILLPYSHWFSTPLSNFGEKGKAICKECLGCNKGTTMEISRKDVKSLKINISKDEEYERFVMDALEEILPDNDEEKLTVSALDGCPFLHAGTCWWFSNRSDEKEKRPKNNSESYRDVLRVRQHTANTRKKYEVVEGDGTDSSGANSLFRAKPFEAYGEWGDEILYDIVVATPTLEVGVDMDNVTDIITHKAIRNIASYRQKVGRAGRSEFTDATASTLISRQPGDFQHYRSPYRLIHKKMVEPVPLAIQNRSVKRNHAYMAIFDWLPKKEHYIDSIAKKRNAGTGWEERIKEAIDELKRQNSINSELYYYLSTGMNLKRDEVMNAIRFALEHLQLFTKEVNTDFGKMSLAKIAEKNAGMTGGFGDIEDHSGSPTANRLVKKLNRSLGALKKNREDFISDGGGFSKNTQNTSLKIIESLTKFIDGKEEKSVVLELIITLRDNIDNEDEEILADYDDVFDNIRVELERLENIISGLEGVIQSSQHLKLAKELIALGSFQRWYLQDIFKGCPSLKNNEGYTMLGALFQNPMASMVQILEASNNPNMQDIIEFKEISAVMRDFLPGSWTYSHGGVPKHIQSGLILEAHQSFDLQGEYIEGLGGPPKVEIVKTQSAIEMNKIPKWARGRLPMNVEVEYLKPLSITIKKEGGINRGNDWDNSVISVHKDMSYAIGKDIKGKGVAEELKKNCMIPSCYPINWITCGTTEFSSTEYGKEVKQFSPEGNDDDQHRRPAKNHPLGHHIFKSIRYDKEIEMHHLVTGLDRGVLTRVGYRYGSKWAVFADNYSTNAMAFHISDTIKQSIKEYASCWEEHPFQISHLEAWGLFLDEEEITVLENGSTADVFAREDYLDCQLHAVIAQLGRYPDTFGEFLETLQHQNLNLQKSIEQKIESKTENQGEGKLREIHSNFEQLSPSLNTDWVESWAQKTVLNTLGGIMVEAGSVFAGVDKQKLNYTFDSQDAIIYLYDADVGGNGTIDMISEYMHIPEAARSAQHSFNGERLPSEDFFTIFERYLMICSEHIIHSLAISGNTKSDDIPEDWSKESMRLRKQSEQEWKALRTDNIRIASLQSRLIEFGSRDDEDSGKRDRQRQAFDLCSSGCPICQSTTNIIPYHARKALTSRGVLDEILDLQNAKGYSMANSEEVVLENLWGKENPNLNYNYKHPHEDYGGFDEIHVQIPTVLSLYGKRNNPLNDYSVLVRHLEEISVEGE